MAVNLTLTPPAVPWHVPPRIRELEARLRQAGFTRQAAKGSHRKWIHPTGRFVVLSGSEGDDAKRYQEAQVDEAIAAARRAKS
jgi:predicted RNA binding protein YcfA (HicA-like mRNA interferase family)